MFELTLIQKVMVGSLGIAYLWFFMWMWRSGYSAPKSGSGFMARFKRKKDSSSNLGYTPAEGYFDQIQKTKNRFGGSWFNSK